jgi:hypothetical protein
MVVQRE